jgi:hypothetical protein
VAETDQLAQDASVAPGRVLPGHPQYRRPHGCCDGRAAGLSARVGPAAGDQLGVPAQQGPGWDEPQAAQRGWVSPWQRGTKNASSNLIAAAAWRPRMQVSSW